MDFFLHFIATFLILVRVQGGTNSFRSGDLAALGMIELKDVRIYDPLGQTRLVPTFQECLGMCLSLSYCLSFNVVKSKADEWLCHATRYNYTDVVLRRNLEVSVNSLVYTFNDRANTSKPRPKVPSCDELKNSSLGNDWRVYLIDLETALTFKEDCKIEFVLPGCTFAIGDGIGGTEVKQIGKYSKPEDCILKCAKQRVYNGVTMSIGFGDECWCEKNMTGRNTHDLNMSCIFSGDLQAYIPKLPSNELSLCDRLTKSSIGLESGVYSITLATRVIKAYCLIELSLPGGWLEVVRLNATQHGNFRLKDAESDNIMSLEQVTSGKFALTQAGLRALKSEFNFTHIRFHCSKTSHNRTIDIATNKSEVINWLLGYTDAVDRPASCGSYYVLPGDTSMISKVCHLWDISGKWGHPTMNTPLLWSYLFYTYGISHWLFDSTGQTVNSYRYLCDDWTWGENLGVWRMFVK